MSNYYLYNKLAQAHYQELLREAEQQRLIDQLPRRHANRMRNVTWRLAAFLMSLLFPVKKVVEPPVCTSH